MTVSHLNATDSGRSLAYRSWDAMIQRCTNPRNNVYHNYGGRGIKVCGRWYKFENFLEDMGERPEGMTLDRYPDKNGDYAPDNCRWADKKTQCRNRRDNAFVHVFGGRLTMAEAVEKFGKATYGRVRQRVYREGWPIEKALTTEGKVN